MWKHVWRSIECMRVYYAIARLAMSTDVPVDVEAGEAVEAEVEGAVGQGMLPGMPDPPGYVKTWTGKSSDDTGHVTDCYSLLPLILT